MTSDRIDGWKAIGRHFGRDRSTVVRWASDRALPVHAIPGGKTRTVYALRSELEAWARRSGEPIVCDGTPPSETTGNRHARWRWSRQVTILAAAGAIAAAAAVVPLATRHAGADRPEAAMPHDATARTLFLSARDDWAKRTRDSLATSIDELKRVTTIEPDFAPAHAYLADAYLLEQEAGSLPSDTAFELASHAAERARALDPGLAPAYRALGFIAYWRDGDRALTGAMFKDAFARDDRDPQTHFWYANILADNGQDAAAMREFDKARAGSPGSPDIAADLAWANWSAGRDALAMRQVRAVVADHPATVEAHDCLGEMLLADGDARGFLNEQAIRARLRGEPALAARSAALAGAMDHGGVSALLSALTDEESRQQDRAAFPNHATAAWYATLNGDRNALLAILRLADRNHEQWGSAGFVRRMAQRTSRDGDVTTLLALRRSSRLPELISSAPVEP